MACWEMAYKSHGGPCHGTHTQQQGHAHVRAVRIGDRKKFYVHARKKNQAIKAVS